MSVSLDFLWQDAIWLVLGLGASFALRWARRRLRRRQLRHFCGADALAESGIAVTVPVLRPLSRDNFDPKAETTTALKTDDRGDEVRRPIYGEVLHLGDYESAEEIFALLRELGANRVDLLPDSLSLGKWEERPCMICLGSPFVNATLGELLRLADDAGGAGINATRVTDTLESYRVTLRAPDAMTLGVDKAHAIGVIARLPNPSKPEDWVIGVWGDRAESTRAAARYLRGHFKNVVQSAPRTTSLIVLLAVRGNELSAVEMMYRATDRVLSRNDELLRWYDRTHLPPNPSTTSGS